VGKRGPKPVKVDLEKLRGVAIPGATVEDMAREIGMEKRTLERCMKRDPEVRDAVENHWAKMRMSLRAWQFERAHKEKDGRVSGATMLVWLGKQLLGQRDYHDSGQLGASVEQVAQAVRKLGDDITDSVPGPPVEPSG